MQAIIKKWGNSPALRISGSIMEMANLKLEQAVNINVLKGKIIIEPISPKQPRLEEMLAGITKSNLHAEENFGPAIGKEIL